METIEFFDPHLALGQERDVMVASRSVRDDIVPVFSDLGHDQVVQNSALLVREDRQNGATNTRDLEVTGRQGFQEIGGVRAGNDALEHVAHVENRGRGSRVPM